MTKATSSTNQPGVRPPVGKHSVPGGIPVRAYVGMGANLGDAAHTLRRATEQMACTAGITLLALSPLYRTAPVDSSGPDYINAVAAIDTTLSAASLLAELQRIEMAHGRERPYHNAPRTLDLDLLLYGNDTINDPDLVVPHPRMHERAFVLRPLADLAPGLLLKQGSLEALLAGCRDQRIQRLA